MLVFLKTQPDCHNYKIIDKESRKIIGVICYSIIECKHYFKPMDGVSIDFEQLSEIYTFYELLNNVPA